jgi:hypothetical protein
MKAKNSDLLLSWEREQDTQYSAASVPVRDNSRSREAAVGVWVSGTHIGKQFQTKERRTRSISGPKPPFAFRTDRSMHRIDAWRMIKRRTQAIGLPEEICNHTFCATGMTASLVVCLQKCYFSLD